MADAKSNQLAIRVMAAKLREADALEVEEADLVDDGGAYSEPWCNTVVAMCNELKADLNAALAILKGITP